MNVTRVEKEMEKGKTQEVQVCVRQRLARMEGIQTQGLVCV
jgi:hypothetical protein